MVSIMAADEPNCSNPSRGRKRMHHRHTLHQTQKLESYFGKCQHPAERQRRQLGKELGLTPTQIKFWFQNKRTLLKVQNMRAEGNALREENERLKIENFATRERLKHEFCEVCKGITNEERKKNLGQLQMENTQLNNKYEQLCKLLASMGISVAKIHSLPPSPRSSFDVSENFEGESIGGVSVDPSDQTLLQYRLKQVQYPDISKMALAIANAHDELSSLMFNEFLWVKDPTDGRYVIHCENYENIFTRINHLKSSRARFESSKVEGIVRMNATQLIDMLLDSTKRLDLFPTIMTKAMTLREIVSPTPGRPSGSFQLVDSHQVCILLFPLVLSMLQSIRPSCGILMQVYEQMHVLSPLVAPRDFYFLRYCNQIGEGTWMVVEVSYDIFNESQEINRSSSWRLPSGCVVRKMPNGCSMVTWVEHVEVDDKALTHWLYRDFIFRGLAYGAEKWLLTLQRMSERFAYEMIAKQDLVEAIYSPEGRRSIMYLSQRMIKHLCANLTKKNKLDIPRLSENHNVDVRFSVYKSTEEGQSGGLIVNAATSLWLPISCQAVFGFLRDGKMRAQWDVLSKGIPFQEIASMSYGDHPGNCISIVEPLISFENKIVVLQESSIDPLGAIVAFCPIDVASLNRAISEGDSSNILLLPSGFIISTDGRPRTIASASSSTNTYASGSLLTVVFQILDCDASSPKHVSMDMVASVKSLVRSTVQNIKVALNCTGVC